MIYPRSGDGMLGAPRPRLQGERTRRRALSEPAKLSVDLLAGLRARRRSRIQGRRILYVGDEPRCGSRWGACGAGAVSLRAGTHDQAVMLLVIEPHLDLAILDFQMPDGDAARLVRRLHWLRLDLPLLGTSASDRRSEIRCAGRRRLPAEALDARRSDPRRGLVWNRLQPGPPVNTPAVSVPWFSARDPTWVWGYSKLQPGTHASMSSLGGDSRRAFPSGVTSGGPWRRDSSLSFDVFRGLEDIVGGSALGRFGFSRGHLNPMRARAVPSRDPPGISGDPVGSGISLSLTRY
jgi:CheY-like chemotaxis protein